MIIVRALTMIAKPAILSGAIATTAVGGWFAFDALRPNDAPSAFQQVQSAGQRLLVSEFGETADSIVAIDPGDVTDRTTIATIEHASGYGIFATLSPDGQAIAYTALPSDTARPGPDTPALAAMVDVNGDVTPLADDVDLLVAPVWSPDSQSIVVRKNTPAEDSAGSIELLLLGRDGSRATLTTWTTASVFHRVCPTHRICPTLNTGH
jgi:Tol biopolymer transport system component